jgi:monoamine oxidase
MSLSRRSFLAGAAASFCRKANAEPAFDTEVAIIGAGAAGLAAAQELASAHTDFILLEARDRIGGRAFTETGLGVPYDAGAVYIHWAETNPWRGIASSLGFATVSDQGGTFQSFDHGARIPDSDRRRRRATYDTLSQQVDADPDSVPDVSLVDRTLPSGPEVAAAAGIMARMTLGEEPERVSALDYARLWSGDDLMVPQGYGTLVGRFGQSFHAQLNSPVSAIDWGGNGVRIETPNGSLSAHCAIITVPIGVLAADMIRFRPILPDQTRDGINGLGMGALTKIAMRFDGERFGIHPATDLFESEGERAIFDFECWPFGRDLVVTYVGGDHARDIVRRGEREAIAIALETFASIVGNTAGQHFVSGKLHAWSEDPYSQGAYSHALPGRAKARSSLATPVAERLYFAGEATGGRDFGGAMTVGGAYLSGRDAARTILRAKE